MVNELIKSFNDARTEEVRTCKSIVDEINKTADLAQKYRDKAEEMDRKLKDLRKKRANAITANWKDNVVVPLAAELAKRTGKKHFTVLGPAGLSSTVYVSLHDDEEYQSLVVREEPYLTIELQAQHGECGELTGLLYETGETVPNPCKPGTVGALGGLNRATAPLPNSIDDIIPLLMEIP